MGRHERGNVWWRGRTQQRPKRPRAPCGTALGFIPQLVFGICTAWYCHTVYFKRTRHAQLTRKKILLLMCGKEIHFGGQSSVCVSVGGRGGEAQHYRRACRVEYTIATADMIKAATEQNPFNTAICHTAWRCERSAPSSWKPASITVARSALASAMCTVAASTAASGASSSPR